MNLRQQREREYIPFSGFIADLNLGDEGREKLNRIKRLEGSSYVVSTKRGNARPFPSSHL